MCGRYVLIIESGDWLRWIPNPSNRLLAQLREEGRIVETRQGSGDQPRLPVFAAYNVRPTNVMPVVTNRDGARAMEAARWGLIPSWWREPTPPKFATFNARDDKLASSGLWKVPVREKRCLVPANGFYEWTGPKGDRVPHYIHPADGSQFAFAGLYDDWTNPETGEALTSYTIITTEPNEFMKPIHNRMPVILPGEEAEALWLDPATDSLDGVKHLIEPREWPEFTEHEVAPLNGDGPELLEAAGSYGI